METKSTWAWPSQLEDRNFARVTEEVVEVFSCPLAKATINAMSPRQVPPPGERRAQLVAGGPCPPGRTSTGQVGGERSLPQTHMEHLLGFYSESEKVEW